jgi:carboxypeptidase PM20D1
LTLGATDARHYAAIADNVYRFTPYCLTMEDLNRMHGVNERIAVDQYARMVRFFAQIIRNSTDL